MMTQEELAGLQREAETELKKYPGVTGLGFGFKRTGGVTTHQLGFTVYVAEKKSPAELRPEEMLPKEFGGFPIDVATLPDPIKAVCEDTTQDSPLLGGVSVAPYAPSSGGQMDVGTLGCFATVNGSQPPENVLLLTNRHVLFRPGVQRGDRVYQPKFSTTAGGATAVVLAEDEWELVGHIHQEGLEGNHNFAFPTEAQAPYFIDCATAKLKFCISCCCRTHCGVKFKNQIRGLNINGNSAVAGVADLRQATLTQLPAGTDYIVYKAGRRTGRTRGKVTQLVAGPFPNGSRNVIEIEGLAMSPDCPPPLRFLDLGDSGAVLVNEQNQVIGLLYGQHPTNPNIAYACHIAPVLHQLNITLITTANPHPAAETLLDAPGLVGEGGVNHTRRLEKKLLRTPAGREVYDLFMAHRLEILELVNHHRPVTVAWHRSQGPAFLAHAVNSARNPGHVVPREVEGVTRGALIRNMARAFADHGSPELKALAERYLAEALAHADGFDRLHELVERVEELELA